jgi:general secretion pathway protein D
MKWFASMFTGCLPVVTLTIAAHSQQAATSLSGRVELARLVDLCAERLDIRIEYDPAVLKGDVVLRVGESISDDELWLITNRMLAARGFTTVRAPGTENLFSVVKLTEAASAATLEDAATEGPTGGFVSIILRARNIPAKQAVESLKPLLSKPGGFAADLGQGGLMFLSDLRSNADTARQILEIIDAPADQVAIERYPIRFVPATQLAASVTATVAARDAIAGSPLKGRVLAPPDGRSVTIIAPPNELVEWRGMIERLDERQSIESRTYMPRSFSVLEVAKLIDNVVREADASQGSGDQWRLVTDDLTNSIIVTATPVEHERVAELLKRLDSVPIEARRPLRSYVIRNRGVNEVLEVLTKLVDQGILAAVDDAEAGDEASLQSSAAGQRSAPSTPLPGAVIATESRLGITGVAEPSHTSQTGTARVGGNGLATSPRQMTAQIKNASPALVLSADEGTNTLIAVGDPRKLDQLGALIRQLDVRQPQVMLEVLVISLSESDTLDLGIELEKLEINGSTLISLTSLFGLTPGSGGDTADPKIPRGRGFTGVVLNPGDFSVVIRALETLNKGRTLNMPKVLVNNNQQATLNAVLQQPFASTNASTTVATTSFGGTQDAGTTVTVKPQIAEGDHLILEYSVALSAFVGESDDPSLPPPRQTNNLSSIVTIPDGYTVVVGGLEITTLADAVSQVPLLGDVPWLGELFKTRSKSTSRSRFFVFIRSDVLRNTGFEDLKYLSDQDATAAVIPEAFRGWPEVEPRIIR